MSSSREQMRELKKQIINAVKDKEISKELAFSLLKELTNQNDDWQKRDVAIVGLSLRFPGANNLQEYWDLLEKGENKIGSFPPSRREDISPLLPDALRSQKNPFLQAGYLEEIDKFDAAYFQISPNEAELMDPYHRLFLEVAYEALEDGGYGGDSLDGSKTGVYAGIDHTNKANFSYLHLIKNLDFLAMTGSKTAILASRISYSLNLNGPSMVFDTGCSSSAVALHAACKALQNKECDMALAGGINLLMLPFNLGMFGPIEAVDREVRAFDKDATGACWGEGVGVVLLKPLTKALEDGDTIYSVIKGSAVNNNGTSNGITSFNAEAQKDLLLTAWKDARIKPETISYIEAHGMGTLVGDAMEVSGLNSSFRSHTQETQICGIGSLKANIGHLVGASGMASLFKVILSFNKELIPATRNYREPNPTINFNDSAVYVVDKPTPWEKSKEARRAGINSFSLSGTNCHFVVEEPPRHAPAVVDGKYQPHIFVLSCRTKEALERLVERYQTYLVSQNSNNLADICFTSSVGRGHYRYRIAIIASTLEELKEKIDVLNAQGVEYVELKDVFCGEHSIVPSTKRDRGCNEITEGEKRQKSKSVSALIKEAQETHKDCAEPLESICMKYVQGADVDWKQFYSGRKTRRVNLPVYPLERTRYWIKVAQDQKKDDLTVGTFRLTKGPLM